MADPGRSATPGEGPPGAEPAGGELAGLGVSQGRAAGPVIRMAPPPVLPSPRQVADLAAEAAAVVKALESVTADLRQRAAGAARGTGGGATPEGGEGTAPAGGGDAAEILDALAMIAHDPMLPEDAEAAVRDGLDAPHALDAAFTHHRETLAALGGYLAERAADLDDLKHRAIAACLGLPMPGI